jgi:UDP-N-acetylglucosamine--N-acetylmuramyl-(pentapeptide) pyrophosphoryl-undecaprenol N-acetylglucosamine transferase
VKLLIAAGGTGGHVFPGLAVAETFVARDSRNEVLFTGTPLGLEGRVIPKSGFRLLYINAYQFTGKSVVYKAFSLLLVLKGVGAALSLLRKERPDAILGMGGFTSVPVVLAGLLARIPCFIHEQNVEPGAANKVLSRYARATFVSFEGSEANLKAKRAIHSGNPLRKSVQQRAPRAPDGTFRIFVFGGSRGARSINDAVLSLLPVIEETRDIALYHQTGEEDFPRAQAAYGSAGFPHEVFPFTSDMERYYNLADLVICRAGATTIFELAYFRKPAVLIPYPFSAGQHQWKNAAYVEARGGAYLIGNDEAEGSRLWETITHLKKEPELLARMGENISTLFVEDAAERIIKGITDGLS